MSASSSNPHGDAPAPPPSSRTHTTEVDPLQPAPERPHPNYDFGTILQSQSTSRTNSPYPINDSYFAEAFRFTPSPPSASFLDNILNPIEHGIPFGYHIRDSPPRRRQRSPLISIQNTMPPTRQRNERPARLPNGYVDLTSMPDSPEQAPRRPKRESPTPGPSSKRMKQNDGTALTIESDSPEATVEEIDLSDDKQTVQDVLQKQREEAVKAQQVPEEKATTFNSFTCVICMDTPTDLTATACGHLFCHTCLMEALIAGENRSAPGEPKRSQCPVCRKIISRSKSTDIIPLLLKKGLATQPRKKSSVTAVPKVT